MKMKARDINKMKKHKICNPLFGQDNERDNEREDARTISLQKKNPETCACSLLLHGGTRALVS